MASQKTFGVISLFFHSLETLICISLKALHCCPLKSKLILNKSNNLRLKEEKLKMDLFLMMKMTSLNEQPFVNY